MMGHSSVVYQPFKRLKMALKSKKRNRGSITMGVVTTLLASLSFTFMSACAKWLPEMPSGEMTLFRGIVGLFFIPLLCLQTKEHFFSGKHKWMLCLRGLFGSIALFFYFLSIEGLTLGDSQILSQLAAFFMCLLSPLFLKEKLPRQAIPGMLATQNNNLKRMVNSGIVFTRRGYDNFVQNGIIEQIPLDLYHPLSIQNRIWMIRWISQIVIRWQNIYTTNIFLML